MVEIRKLVCIDGIYQILEPERADGRGNIIWGSSGEPRDLSFLYDLVQSRKFQFFIDPAVATALSEYVEKRSREGGLAPVAG